MTVTLTWHWWFGASTLSLLPFVIPIFKPHLAQDLRLGVFALMCWSSALTWLLVEVLR